MGEGRLIITFVPSLVATLLNRERSKGAPLTEQEVLDIRDNAAAIALPADEAAAVEAERGYKDIDAANVWAAWHEARKTLI
jgi:phage terminase Nu1 subunit (DNA packaging protein)